MSFGGKNKSSRLKDFSIGEYDYIPSLVTSSSEIDESKLKDNVEIVSEEKIDSCNKQFQDFEPLVDFEKSKIPITIITGYLGSGKSTMLNYITNNVNKTNIKIAVIMNEFGDTLDIEKSITIYNKEQSANAEEKNSVEWLDLGNGCICCSVKDVGVKAIEDLVKRQRKNIDYIILETSGLAEPSNIAKMFWLDDGLMTNIRLDGIITVLDGANIETILSNQNDNDIAIRQIGISDKIILNKIDKIDKCHLNTIKNQLKSINNSSEVIETKFGQLDDLNKIMFLNSYSEYSDFNDKVIVGDISNHQDKNIETIKIDLPILTTLDQYKNLKSYLQKIHWQNFGYNYGEIDNKNKEYRYGEILRSKGLIVCNGFDPFTKEQVHGLSYKVLQGVRDTFDIMNTSSKPLQNISSGKLVLIGKKFDTRYIVSEISDVLKGSVNENNHVHTNACSH
ncbi:hypothetical protein QEN19_002153 [Hanseniaspora menglaensis]